MFDFKLPDLGEGIHEGQVVNVLVKEGDTIAEYQPMLEVETDKAAVEIPSPKSGIVAKVNVQPGQMVKVGQVMLSIDESAAGGARVAPAGAAAPKAAAPPAPPKAAPPPARPAAQAPSPPRPVAPASPPAAAPTLAPGAPPARPAAPRPAAARVATPAPAVRAPAAAPPAPAVRPTREGPVPAAPAVRKLAREMGVDINLVPGSGPHGRVMREDVERFIGGGGFEPSEDGRELEAAFAAADRDGAILGIGLPTEALPDFEQWGPVRREPVPQIRKTIARTMSRSWLTVARVTHGDVADITELERNRKRLNEHAKERQPKMTITAIVLKAVATALRDFPAFNSSFDHAHNEIIYKDYIHIGAAVDTPRGLVVPVVRDVDRKSLPQVARELNDIAERTRQAKFDIAELRGGTFTVTNVGALGGTFATPMVNYPEVAILGLGRASLQPVVRDGQIVPRLMLPLFLSFDHRVVDGADAARFTREIVESLENPLRMISM